MKGICEYVSVEGTCEYTSVEGTCEYTSVEGTCEYMSVEGTCECMSVEGTYPNSSILLYNKRHDKQPLLSKNKWIPLSISTRMSF